MIALRVALVVTVAALLALGVAPGAEASVLPGYCPDAGGVTVIVDFQELGGVSIVRCAQGDQATGLAALKSAGIPIAGTARWGESYICRVDGKPGPESEPCVTTPPASAHWSYWYATDGGWKISEAGVTARKPAAGSFEGWSFSLNKTSDPPPRLAPRRPPPAAPPPAVQPLPPAPQKQQPAGKPAATPTPTSVSPTETVPPTSSTTASSSAPVSSTGSVSWTGEVDQAAAQGSSGPSAGLLVGVGIVVLLAAGAAGVTVRRKRAAKSGD